MLKIKQIDGLQSELDSKISGSHNHAASDITSGAFVVARIPSLAASKITTGTFGTSRIPSLAASKITTGTFGTGRIPTLAVSKISGLQTELNTLQSNIDDIPSPMINVDGAGDVPISVITYDTGMNELTFRMANGQNLTLNAGFVNFP